GSGGVLSIDDTVMPSTVISGFTAGDSIDLTGVAYDSGGNISLQPGDVLQLVESGITYDLNLDSTANGERFAFAADSGGTGTAITASAVTQVTVVSGETYVVSGGQTDNGDVVLSGGIEIVSLGGIASTTNVLSGGILSVQSGAITYGSLLSGISGNASAGTAS